MNYILKQIFITKKKVKNHKFYFFYREIGILRLTTCLHLVMEFMTVPEPWEWEPLAFQLSLQCFAHFPHVSFLL